MGFVFFLRQRIERFCGSLANVLWDYGCEDTSSCNVENTYAVAVYFLYCITKLSLESNRLLQKELII